MTIKPETVKQIISNLDFEQIWLYNLYDQMPSFQLVAKESHRSSNSVRDRMLAANRLFDSIFYLPLMECHKGRYELTVHGKYVANLYDDLAEFVVDAMRDFVSTRTTYVVPCVTTLIDKFYELNAQLPDSADFELSIDLRRTADLQYHIDQPSSTRIALGSVLGSPDQGRHEGEWITIQPSVRLLVMRSEPLFLLGNKSLNLGATSDINAVLERGIRLLMPTDGVAWTFMQQAAFQWNVRRPYQHKAIPYLDSGLLTLRHEEHAAMVVHGGIGNYLKENPEMTTWKLSGPNGSEHRALSGLIVDMRANMDDGHFKVIKDCASIFENAHSQLFSHSVM
jgi:hypothetical protein